jgi:hypothetical protein
MEWKTPARSKPALRGRWDDYGSRTRRVFWPTFSGDDGGGDGDGFLNYTSAADGVGAPNVDDDDAASNAGDHAEFGAPHVQQNYSRPMICPLHPNQHWPTPD